MYMWSAYLGDRFVTMHAISSCMHMSQFQWSLYPEIIVVAMLFFPVLKYIYIPHIVPTHFATSIPTSSNT